MRAAVALLAALLAGPAMAQMAPGTGPRPLTVAAVICDTGEQAEAVIAGRNAGAEMDAAITAVNARTGGSTACGMSAVALLPIEVAATRVMDNQAVQIVKVEVAGGFDGAKWVHAPPTVQFAILKMKGIGI